SPREDLEACRPASLGRDRAGLDPLDVGTEPGSDPQEEPPTAAHVEQLIAWCDLDVPEFPGSLRLRHDLVVVAILRVVGRVSLRVVRRQLLPRGLGVHEAVRTGLATIDLPTLRVALPRRLGHIIVVDSVGAADWTMGQLLHKSTPRAFAEPSTPIV